MISRRMLLATAPALVLLARPALAVQRADYTQAAFDAAEKAGKSILVEIHAVWCPTCKAQKPILAAIEKDPKFKDLLVLHVDFDRQKDVVVRFKAHIQSTLITFHNGKEMARSVGDTDPQSLAALLQTAI